MTEGHGPSGGVDGHAPCMATCSSPTARRIAQYRPSPRRRRGARAPGSDHHQRRRCDASAGAVPDRAVCARRELTIHGGRDLYASEGPFGGYSKGSPAYAAWRVSCRRNLKWKSVFPHERLLLALRLGSLDQPWPMSSPSQPSYETLPNRHHSDPSAFTSTSQPPPRFPNPPPPVPPASPPPPD